MSGPELKPCPFCDSGNIDPATDGDGWWVKCRTCGTEGPIDDIDTVAIAAWNRRALSAAPQPAPAPWKSRRQKESDLYYEHVRDNCGGWTEFAKMHTAQSGWEHEVAFYASRLPALPAQPAPAVGVKPLKWELIDDEHWGATALDCLSYEVLQARASVRVRFPLAGRFEVFDGTVEEAKAAAQADYETRIRAALSTEGATT